MKQVIGAVLILLPVVAYIWAMFSTSGLAPFIIVAGIAVAIIAIPVVGLVLMISD